MCDDGMCTTTALPLLFLYRPTGTYTKQYDWVRCGCVVIFFREEVDDGMGEWQLNCAGGFTREEEENMHAGEGGEGGTYLWLAFVA